MGWVANEPGDENKDRFPVETLVNKLQSQIRLTEEACIVFNGQTKQCCAGIRACFVYLADAFTVVRLQAIGNQNMHQACRSIQFELEAATSCVDTWSDKCHFDVDKSIIVQPFYDNLDTLKEQKHESCSKLPPEPLTSPESTETPNVTSSRMRTSTAAAFNRKTSIGIVTNGTMPKDKYDTHNQGVAGDLDTPKPPEVTSEPASSALPISSTPTDQNNTVPVTTTRTPVFSGIVSSTPDTTNGTLFPDGRNNVTSLPELSDAVIIVPSVVGISLLIALTVVVVLVLRRKFYRKNIDGDGSNGSRSISAHLWKCLQQNKAGTAQSNTNDTEVYAEIDEAFMEAVYGIDQDEKKQAQLRDRTQNSLVNLCYEAPNDTKVIMGSAKIAEADKEKSASPSKTKPDSRRPSRLDYFRKEDDMVTSFQMDQSKMKAESDRKASVVTANQKSFVTSRPWFTAIRQEDAGHRTEKQNEYVSVAGVAYTPEEPIYSVLDSEYGYGQRPPDVIPQALENYEFLAVKQRPLPEPKRDTEPVVPRVLPESKNVISELKPFSASEYSNKTPDDEQGRSVPEYMTSFDIKKNKKNDKRKDKRHKSGEKSVSVEDINVVNVYENDDTMMVY